MQRHSRQRFTPYLPLDSLSELKTNEALRSQHIYAIQSSTPSALAKKNWCLFMIQQYPKYVKYRNNAIQQDIMIPSVHTARYLCTDLSPTSFANMKLCVFTLKTIALSEIIYTKTPSFLFIWTQVVSAISPVSFWLSFFFKSET